MSGDIDTSRASLRSFAAADIGAYAVGSLGTGIFSTVPTVLLLFYCTETLKIAPGLAAIVLFVPKFWAIIWDPTVGLWSDRTTSRLGRRTPFLAVGSVGIFASFLAVFHTPTTSPGNAFVWIVIAYFSLATLYSVFAVPYIALPSELGTTPALRSALVSTRMMTASLGNLAGASFAPMLVQYFGGGHVGYASMSWVLALTCLIATMGPILVMRGREQEGTSHRKASFVGQLTVAVLNPEFRLLGLSYVLQIGATGAFIAMVPYLITKVAGQTEGQAGVALGLMLLVATVASPIWGWLGTRYGNRAANIWALVLYAAGLAALGAAAFTHAPYIALQVIFAVLGFPFSATQVLPFTRQAHIAHAAATATSSAMEGAYAGSWTAVEKLGLAAGPSIAALSLSAMGNHVAADVPAYLATVAPFILLLSIVPLIRMDRGKEPA